MYFNLKVVALAATLLGYTSAQSAPATNPNAPTNDNDAPADIGEEPPTVEPVPFNGDSEHLPTHPDFFPTPETPGTGAWAEATGKARDLVYSLSVEERVNITTGVGWGNGPCVGNIAPIRDVFPGLCLQDGPLGVRQVEQASAFPAGINVAASFDKDLAYQRGLAMGTEFKEKGAHVALSPSIDFGRNPTGGRNWEGFGADPYLQGELGSSTIYGLQDAGVQATAKHYFVNNQERYRYTSSSNVDERAIREIYLHPYVKAVQANVASVMCSYNKILQSWACENSYLLNGILKHELAFQGYVQSDWQAQYSGTPSALAGLDMSMPGDSTFYSGWSYFGANLTEAVANGTVPEERVNDMATRIVAAWYLLGQDEEDYPEVNFNFFDENDPTRGPVRDVRHDHASLIKELGSASTVLLKNDNNALPLDGSNLSAGIAVVGSDAGPASKGPNGCADRACVDGTVAVGWGSGANEFPYLVDPLSALEERGALDGFSVENWLNNWDINNDGFNSVVQGKEAAIVFVNSDSGEQYLTVQGNEGDRNNLTAWNNGDEVVKATAAHNENTIVVIHAPGQLDVEEWVEHPNVTAILWAGFPGQESGNAITDVLFGYYNPSAKLPFTIAKQREDYGTEVVYHDSSDVPQLNYTESIFVDYRHFQQDNIEPRYPFGFGLSYTTFDLDNLQIEEVGETEHEEYDPDMFGASVQESLHKPAYKVSIDVTNTGEIYGAEVVQLYLQFPRHSGEPPLVLRDFAKVPLAPGETKTAEFELSIYDLSIWDTEKRQWVKPDHGLISVVFGTSSEDERIVQSL